MSPKSTRVLGIDPGVSETGWAVLESVPNGSPFLAASGIIRTSPKDIFPNRLRQINEGVAGLMRKYHPDSFAIEEMFFTKIANSIRATLQTRGVILLAAAVADTPVHEYNPRQVKLTITGSGTSPKAQMQKMVSAILGLPKLLTPHDVADAAAIAVCHIRSHRTSDFLVLDRLGGKRGRS